ncbi:MAG: hypothetical protein K6T78_01620 [Alicyclobacillus sp.]|nr:hypothetical protein [Alicyclobacillus sp.]
MRRYSWLLTLLVIVAVFFIRRGTIPAADYPSDAVPTAAGVQVAVQMEPAASRGESWTLMRQSNGTPVVMVYTDQRPVARFIAGSKLDTKDAGTTYATSGQIKLGLETYQATEIHISADHKSGYILLHSTDTTGLPANAVNGVANDANAAANAG